MTNERSRRRAAVLAYAISVMCMTPHAVAGQTGPGATTGYAPARTPWGDPDLAGFFTNKDEFNTPLERPEEFEGLRIADVDRAELARLIDARQAQHRATASRIGGADTGAGPTHWFESFTAVNSQPWFIVDPPDGRIPALTPAAQRREAAIARLNDARNGEGLADSWVDRSMWDRCITRGLPGSMMPNIYGNAYQILQTPGYVAIRYEMVHDTRIIPLDARPHLGEGIREYFGDARGRWEGNTLVVESTNFTDRSHMGYNNQYNSRAFRLTERFTPIAADRLYWEVTVDDPETWTRPWTFAMPLTKNDRHAVFEYACHEGNYGLVNLLSGARAEEGRRGR